MVFPEDRVLVGVINRKRDLQIVQEEKWYRIPQSKMPRGVNTEYVAFFLSRAFKERNGSIPLFAEFRGVELAYRKDLLPKEANHPRANEVYYKVQVSDLMEKSPPVLNPTRRPIAFIYTTWDRFFHAQTVADLYSTDDYFVDRIYHALRDNGITSERTWKAEYPGVAPELRILCENGLFTASTERGTNRFYLDQTEDEDKLLAAIKAEIAKQGGPVYARIPPDSSM
jgi:hypothetical protein